MIKVQAKKTFSHCQLIVVEQINVYKYDVARYFSSISFK